VAADDDRLGPTGYESRHVLADDRLAEDGAAEDVADGAVGRAPHLLELELLHAAFVRRDGGAFHRDADFLGLVGGIDGDLIVGLVAVLDAEVVIEKVDVEIGMNQLVLDQLPDDPSHLVAIHLDDGVGHLDFRHEEENLLSARGLRDAAGRRARMTPGPVPAGVAIAPGSRRRKPGLAAAGA
jgi:hypothetical protein